MSAKCIRSPFASSFSSYAAATDAATTIDGAVSLLSAPILNFINGAAVPAARGATLDIYNPATGEVATTIPRSSAEDVELAVSAAAAAASEWGATTLAQRAALLQRVADIVEQRKETFAALETRDSGKPLKLSMNVDIPRAVANLRFFADFAATAQSASAYHPTDGVDGSGMAAVNLTQRSPLGVVSLVTPWNLPIYLLSWKVAPALMCGNTIVAKPSEITPSTASLLAEVFHEVGAPRGILNVVHGLGPEAAAPMVVHPEVKAISFTGGTATGRVVAQAAAGRFIKASLELGGKNAALVFADAISTPEDIAATARAVARSSFLNSGQICLCTSRILVERPLGAAGGDSYEAFLEALVAETKELKVGDPLDASTDLGPLSSLEHRAKVQGYIDLAIHEEGGKALCGGLGPRAGDQSAAREAPEDAGAFLDPTLIVGLGADSRTATEEIFGPVATIHPFSSEAEAVEVANATPYGLCSSVWTKDLERAHRVGRCLDVGMVWVNTWLHRDLRTPFGGVKDSGVGREGGQYSLEFFSETKNLCIALDGNRAVPPMPSKMK